MSIPNQTKILLSTLLLVASAVIVPQIKAAEVIGAFTFLEKLDEFTDENRSIIYSFDEEGDKSLDWWCMSDGLNVIIDLNQYFGGDDDDDILVRYRFDDKPAVDFEYWRLLDSNETAYIRMNKVSAFTEAALASNEVLLEAADPFDDETIRFRVSLNGLREALGKLTCAP
jgi:hypothetical protein